MPVAKFRSIGDMNDAPVRAASGDPFERFLRHCARYRALSGITYPRGVFKFRSSSEAQAARERVAHHAARRRE